MSIMNIFPIVDVRMQPKQMEVKKTSSFQFHTSLFTSQEETKFNFEALQALLATEWATIIDTNYPDNGSKEKNVRFVLKDLSTAPPAHSSQHVVFFAEMIFENSQSQKKEVCLKFTIPKDYTPTIAGAAPEVFFTFTQKHANYVLYNYNVLQEHAKTFKPQSGGAIQLNTVYCCQLNRDTRQVSFWVEDKLNHFTKFWDERRQQYIDKILTTAVPILREFQHHIYDSSGYAYTVIDLQGEHVKENDSFILCDIELSLSSLYEYSPSMLLDRVVNIYGWKKVTLKTIEDKLETLSTTVEGLSTTVEGLSTTLSQMSSLLQQLAQHAGLPTTTTTKTN